MKVLYIESKLRDLNINLSKEEVSKLPKKLFIAYSIQYKGLIPKIVGQLEKNNIKITKTQQVLGCSNVNTKDPILLIGAGRFHAKNLYIQAPEVYVLENSKIVKISEDEIESFKRKRKAALANFLNSDNIGILVTTKPGQENLSLAISLKEKIEKKNKNAFIFISESIDTSQFENFNIGSWVNTACPGLSSDNSKIINYQDIKF